MRVNELEVKLDFFEKENDKLLFHIREIEK
jgi:hypothetical protein